jgi:hypothetical protein
MRNDQSVLEALDAIGKRREARRGFLRAAGGVAVAAGGASLLTGCFDGDDDDVAGGGGPVATPSPTPAPSTAIGDADILNFALQLEYLEAQYYSFAVFGTGLPGSQLSGTGTQGAVFTTGSAPPRAVNFSGEPLIAQYAREIAQDEIAHVAFLRTALGSAAVAQPPINISGDATGAFTAAARAAGVVPATGTFDPYSSPDFFLLGAFLFEDVGVTAYKGAAPLLSSKVFLEAAAGILAAEAYHAGLVRTILFARGQSNAQLITAAGQISDARDTLDGTPADDPIRGIGADDDQGIAATGTGANSASNLVPANSNALAYSRDAARVLNIVFLSRPSVTTGGFFPQGLNGRITTSAAN